MKDLQQLYLRLASELERRWTHRSDKRNAAILVRNAAIDTPHCRFCGEEGEFHTSSYNHKTSICKLCSVEIAAVFAAGTEPHGVCTTDSEAAGDRSSPPGQGG